jgi:HSP20 family protein
MERSMGTIHRVMTLPGPVEDDGMTTTYKDGILTVTVQKKKSESGE